MIQAVHNGCGIISRVVGTKLVVAGNSKGNNSR